jgi:mannose-6-phosphate isomerase-like protein (cupin superfamily)
MAKNASNFEQRPWGTFEILSEFKLADGSDVVIKKFFVKPLKRLSYQSHKLRMEHWLILEGAGKVILDDQVIPVKAGSKITVPLHTKHRLINEDKQIDLVFIEISTGTFDEHDIVRFEDDFGRT